MKYLFVAMIAIVCIFGNTSNAQAERCFDRWGRSYHCEPRRDYHRWENRRGEYHNHEMGRQYFVR